MALKIPFSMSPDCSWSGPAQGSPGYGWCGTTCRRPLGSEQMTPEGNQKDDIWWHHFWLYIPANPTKQPFYLVGGLEHGFYCPIYWESHHPNWLSYFSEGFKPLTSINHMINYINYASNLFGIYWSATANFGPCARSDVTREDGIGGRPSWDCCAMAAKVGEVANGNGGCGASKIGTRLSELVRGACKATKTTGDVTFPVEIVLSSYKHQARTSSVP